MHPRRLTVVIATITVLLLAQSVAGQAVPRTPWGHPDLQGLWNNSMTNTSYLGRRRVVYFLRHFDCFSKSEGIFKWGRVEGAAPPIIVAIRREEVLQVIGLDMVQVLALDTPKVAR